MSGDVRAFPGVNMNQSSEDPQAAAQAEARRRNAATLREWADRLESGELQNLIAITMQQDGMPVLMSGSLLGCVALASFLHDACKARVTG